MTAILLTPPVSEPLTLAEIKTWLRIDASDEDALLASLLATARATIEREARRCLMAQTWRITRDAWPADGVIGLPLAPVQAVTAIRVLSEEGFVVVPATAYRLDLSRETPRIWITGMVAYPGIAGVGIEIDVLCGHASPEQVPETLRHAVRMLVARLYERRGDGIGDIAALPADIAHLLAGYRRPRLA